MKVTEISLSLISISLFTVANYVDVSYWIPGAYHSIPYVLGGVTLIIILLERFSNRSIHKGINIPQLLMLTLLILSHLSANFATVNELRSDEYVTLLSKAVALFFLIPYSINSVKDFSIYLVVLALGAFYVSYMMIHFPNYSDGRCYAEGSTLVSDPNDVAMLIVYSLPLVLVLFHKVSNWPKRVILVYVVFTMALAFFEANSRGGFLGFLVLLMMIIYEIPGSWRKIKIGFLILLLLVPFSLRYATGSFTSRMHEITDVEQDETGSAQIRMRNMEIALDYTLSTLFSSYGPGNNGYLMADAQAKSYGRSVFEGDHVHSSYLEIGADVGLIACLAFLLFHLSLFVLLRQAKKLVVMHEDDKESRKILLYIKVLRISLVGYMVTSFFLPVAYRFYLYYIGGLCVSIYYLANHKIRRVAAP